MAYLDINVRYVANYVVLGIHDSERRDTLIVHDNQGFLERSVAATRPVSPLLHLNDRNFT